MGLKLNLGSGRNPQTGYLNVDKYGEADLKCDLESFPWPWEAGTLSSSDVDELVRRYNNVAVEIRFKLRAVKDPVPVPA